MKKNKIKFSGGQVARKTGYYDIGQDGQLVPSINIMPTEMWYLADGSLKIKFMLWNFSTVEDWNMIKRLRGLYIRTNGGKVLVDIDPVNLVNGFSLKSDETKYLTLKIPANRVKKVVNLNKTSGIKYAVDIYLRDEWYNP